MFVVRRLSHSSFSFRDFQLIFSGNFNFFKGNHKCLDSRLEKSQDLGLTDNDLFDMFGR